MGKQYVIFKEFGKYKMTSDDNYNCFIRDESKVITIVNCNNDDEAMQAAINAGFRREEIIYA